MELFQNLKKSVSLILLLAAGIVSIGFALKADSYQQTEKEIVIKTMTNIEVMGCILGLVFKHHNKSQLAATIAPHPLREKAMEHFSQFHDHPAVKQTAKMDESGFPWDGFVRVALHYSELPETKLVYPWNEEDQDVFLSKLPVERKSLSAQKAYLDDYMEKIKKFYQESNFEKFFKDHQVEYASSVQEVKQAMEGRDLAVFLEDYFGWENRGYFMVPTPLFPVGNFGPRIEVDGKYLIYYIMVAIKGTHGEFRFAPPEILRSNLAHEFGHSFLNPVLQKHWDQVKPYSHFFGYMKEDMVKQGYSTWRSCMSDHLARAFESRYLSIKEGKEVGQRVLGAYLELGFRLLPHIYEKMIEYENNRDKYQTFRQFFPQITDTLAQLRPVKKTKPAQLGLFMGLNEDLQGLVRAVLPGTPAAKAGIKRGDIVLKIGEVSINSRETLREALSIWNNAQEEEKIPILIQRDKEKKTILIKCVYQTYYNFVKKENSGFEKILKKPLPLNIRYKVGHTFYYKLTRESVIYKMDGSKSGEIKAEAFFTRTRATDDSQGRVSEEFSWNKFCFGQSMSPSMSVKMSCLEEAKDFSLTFSIQNEDCLSNLDFSSLPRNMMGMWFMIMVWDAVTFDGLTRPQKHFPFPDKACIGTEIASSRGPYDFSFEYPPILTESKYSFSGKNFAKVSGITMVNNIPCVQVEFSSTENKTLMNMNLGSFKMKNQGFESFWGKTYLSLEDGSIVKGELVAPIVQIQEVKISNQEEPQYSKFLIMQILKLDQLTEKIFYKKIQD